MRSDAALLLNLIRGNAAIVGVDGQLLYRIGDPDYFTYMRSTAKPLQASAAVECGAIDHFKITDAELAVMCGSHIGDQYHIDALESILAKIGLSESDYTFGEDLSFQKSCGSSDWSLKSRQERFIIIALVNMPVCWLFAVI